MRDTTAYPIHHQWTQPIASDAEPQLDNSAFSSVLAAHTPFTAGVPVLDERFIHTYLSHICAARARQAAALKSHLCFSQLLLISFLLFFFLLCSLSLIH